MSNVRPHQPTPLPAHVYVLKLLVVLACYALSGFGMLLMFLGGVFASAFAGWWQLLLLLWLAAAVAHVLLSLAWLEGRHLGKRASLIAGTLGTAGLLAFPLLLHLSNREFLSPQQFLEVAAVESLAVLPALLLATYLTWYHARPQPLGRQAASRATSANAA